MFFLLDIQRNALVFSWNKATMISVHPTKALPLFHSRNDGFMRDSAQGIHDADNASPCNQKEDRQPVTEALWTKDFIFCWLIRLFATTVFLMLLATVAPYCMQQFNASSGEAGLASGVFVLSATICRLVAGRGIDLVGRRKSLVYGLSLIHI